MEGSRAKEFVSGQMARNTTASGCTTKNMASAYIPGKTAVNMKASTKMIKSMEQELILGQMVASM